MEHDAHEITEQDLDAATEEHRAGRGQPTEPCRNGHFECAYIERGECEQEAVAEIARRRAEGVVTEVQLDAMVTKAVEAADADIGEALRKAITAQVGSDWPGDVDPPTAFQWDEALRRLVRCLMLNAFDLGDDGELIRR